MLTRSIVINDNHFPFHNPRLFHYDCTGLIPDIIDDCGYDRIILNGDLLDMYNWNSYHLHPDVLAKWSMQDELDVGREFIQSLRKRWPKKEIVYLLGNHEDRMERWVIEKAKPLHNILRFENELQLELHDIEFYPYTWDYQIENSKCHVMHSPASYGENGANTSLKKKVDSTYIYGCSHRQQTACVTGASGEVYESYFNGWLGSIDETPEHRQVFKYRKGHFNWQNCFADVVVIDGFEYIVSQYSIRNEKVFIDGNLWIP